MTWITATLVLSTSSAWSFMSSEYISTLAIAQYPCPMNVRIAPDEVETMLDRGTSQRTGKRDAWDVLLAPGSVKLSSIAHTLLTLFISTSKVYKRDDIGTKM
jgi:hypothetical protein